MNEFADLVLKEFLSKFSLTTYDVSHWCVILLVCYWLWMNLKRNSEVKDIQLIISDLYYSVVRHITVSQSDSDSYSCFLSCDQKEQRKTFWYYSLKIIVDKVKRGMDNMIILFYCYCELETQIYPVCLLDSAGADGLSCLTSLTLSSVFCSCAVES